MSAIHRKIRPLLGKVAASVADQAATSGTNFTMNVLLARWLAPSDYGAFSVSWSFCLIFAALHNALVLEPMTVVGPAEYTSRLRAYLKAVTRLNWYVVLVLGAAAANLALFYREPGVRLALATLGMALPGYLLLLTSRREQYILNHPLRAFHISLVYAVVLVATLLIFRSLNWLSALTGVLCIGVALPIAVWALSRRGLHRLPVDSLHSDNLTSITQAHWKYGKWLFASAILGMGLPDVQTILLSAMVDLKSAGALRAMMNFILPLSQLLTVLSVFALPKLARHMKQFGLGRGLRQSLIYPIAVLAMALAYVLLLVLLGSTLEHFLYNGRIAAYVKYLPELALAAFVSAIGAAFSTLLRAARNSQHSLVAGIAGMLVGVGKYRRFSLHCRHLPLAAAP
jgi:O-antigen/teichoic acid export membrane protein